MSKKVERESEKMRANISKILFGLTGFLPLSIIMGLAYVGDDAPVVGRVVSEAAFLETSNNKVEVVYFGYVDCAFICPTSLYTLGKAIDEILIDEPGFELGAFFVDVNAEAQIQRADEYSKYFSENIAGVNLNSTELDNLRTLFGITVIDTKREMDRIIHTDHFFIFKQEVTGWEIAKILPNTSTKEELKSAIKNTIFENEGITANR